MNEFGPGEVKSVRDQYQPSKKSDSLDPNFHVLITSVAASQKCTQLARLVIVSAVVFLN